MQLPLCDAPIVAVGVLYLPSQPGGSSLSSTWTGSPRWGRGHRRGKARGIAKGLVMAGQCQRGFNIKWRSICVRRGGVRHVTRRAVLGEVKTARFGVRVDVKRRRGGGGRGGRRWGRGRKARPAQRGRG